MEDMAPELLQTIRLAWQKALISDAELRSLTKRITEGKATYKEVEDIAYRVGKDLSKALVGNITSDIMPDGHVPQNVAEKILQPTLREAHAMVIEAATKTQEAMNKAAGIGLKAQVAEFDAEKAQGLVYKLTNGLLEDTGWILDAPVTEFVQSSADRTMKKNVDFQARAGLHPIITREAEGKCCKWCSNLEGSYEYGDEPRDIYRRHRRCRCVVDYRPGNGKRQNVWSKAWHEDAEPEVVEERKKRLEELRMEKEQKIGLNISEKQGNIKVAEQSRRVPGNNSSTIISPIIETKEYEDKIRLLNENDVVTALITNHARTTLYHRNGTLKEDLIFINPITNNHRAQRNYNKDSECKPTKKMEKMLKDNPKTIIAMHNHPQNMLPSLKDLKNAKYYKYGVILCHNGDIIKYTVHEDAMLEFADMVLNDMQRDFSDITKRSGYIELLKGSGVFLEIF